MLPWRMESSHCTSRIDREPAAEAIRLDAARPRASTVLVVRTDLERLQDFDLHRPDFGIKTRPFDERHHALRDLAGVESIVGYDSEADQGMVPLVESIDFGD